MTNTQISIHHESFWVNGQLTYSEISGSPKNVRGLLMNARFIQGVFDDRVDPARFARFGKNAFDPEQNTDDLIAALAAWYAIDGKVYPFVILESVWALTALVRLLLQWMQTALR